MDLSKMAVEENKKSIENLSKLTTPKLYRKQDLVEEMIKIAEDNNNNIVLKNLKIIQDHLTYAIIKKGIEGKDSLKWMIKIFVMPEMLLLLLGLLLCYG